MAVLLALTGGAAFAALPSGVDVSSYQHSTSLNWSAVKSNGAKFAFIKASEGAGYSNPYFRGDWAATGRLGIYHGAYHFARPSIGSASAQARYFARVIGPQTARGTLPPVLDLEATGGLSPARLITWTRTWLTTVAQLTGRDPMIYVSPMFWKYHLNNSAAFHAYPLWVANYGVSRPMVPGNWPTWSFWQTTSSARVSGISGNVDRDVFNGSLTQLQKFARAFSPSPTTVTLRASNLAPMSGQSVTFSGTLSDTSGHPVTGKRITISAQAPGSSTPTPVGTATTSRTGSYSFTTVVVSAAGYRASFGGDADFRSAVSPVANVTLTPIPTAVSLASTASEALAGSQVTLSGVLTVQPNKPLAGQRVTISRQLAGSSVWSVLARPTTDSTGAFTVAATMMKSASYRAQFAGSAVYASSTAPSRSISVTLNPSTLSLAVSNSRPYAHHYVTMDGTLLNGTNPVAGRTVTLVSQAPGSATWTAVASVTTDAAGHFAARPLVDRPATYRAVFRGDSLYAASTSDTRTVTITPPTPTRLTARDGLSSTGRLHRGRQAVLSGQFLTETGQPIVGRTVGVWKRLAGTSRWYRVATSRTVAPDGSWQVTVRPTRSCWFKAVFYGTSRYAAAHSAALRINVVS